ncbi:unnamed protein product, partial [Oncorhynchus mykiss]
MFSLVCTLSLEQDACYLAIGPVVLEEFLIGQPPARVGGYKWHHVPLFCGEKLRTGETEHLTPSITGPLVYYLWCQRLLKKQLIAHLNNSPFTLHSMQFGFRAKHSTETANCLSKMDKGGAVGAVFLDLRKAFDTVNHEILITKLSKFNFSPDALRWMKSYLEGRTQCVRVS